MSDGELVHTGPVLQGELLETDQDYLQAVYGNSGIEDALARYIDSHSSDDSDAVEMRLARFCNVTAATALKDGAVDVDVVRSAFELVTAGMNEVASRVYGYEPQGAVRSLLVRAGLQAPKPDRYVRYLDDRYWSSQFMDQYQNGGMPMEPRQEGESEQEFLARYTFTCLQGLLFAPFTFAV